MSQLSVITVPKSVFQELHPEEAKVFRTLVLSGAFKLAMSAAMAEFQSHCPTEERGRGAKDFAETFQQIAEVEVMPVKPKIRTISRPVPEAPVNKFLIPTTPTK